MMSIAPEPDESVRSTSREQVCRDMVRRGIPGCASYFVIWTVLAHTTVIATRLPLLTWFGIIILGLFGLLRGWYSLRFESLHGSDPAAWLRHYGMAVLGTSTTWAILSSVVLYEFLPDAPAAYLVAIATVAVAAGGMASVMSHLWLQRAHILITCIPAIAVCLFHGPAEPLLIAIFLVGWSAYLIYIGRQLNQQFLRVVEANALLDRLAKTDPLTGIPNRRAFDERFDAEFRRAIRLDQSLTVLILDIDHFKQYNDTYGHIAGDSCLEEIAGAMSRRFRRGTDVVARYGGEEFAALITASSPALAAEQVSLLMDDIVALGIPHSTSTVAPVVTISMGAVTCRPTTDSNTAEILNRADRLLYRAKSAGRNLAIMLDADSGDEEAYQPEVNT